MKKLFLFTSAIAMAGFISSCGNSNDGQDGSNGTDTTGTGDSTSMNTTMPEESQEYISIPSPDEMFSFMKDIGTAGKSTNFLNNPENVKNYLDSKSKALNFGIYATDFLYCSTFDFGSDALKYFMSVKKLGDDLGISNIISQSIADRIKVNIGKNDSLTDISNTLYFSSVAELEKSAKAPQLSLLIAGGWIESMYLVTNMAKYKANDPAIDRIAEQKYTLDNLIGYLDKYKSDANVASVQAQMNELKGVYDQLKEESTSGTVSAKGGKKVLGGGTKITITEAQYKAISEKVKSIHDSFTSGK